MVQEYHLYTVYRLYTFLATTPSIQALLLWRVFSMLDRLVGYIADSYRIRVCFRQLFMPLEPNIFTTSIDWIVSFTMSSTGVGLKRGKQQITKIWIYGRINHHGNVFSSPTSFSSHSPDMVMGFCVFGYRDFAKALCLKYVEGLLCKIVFN